LRMEFLMRRTFAVLMLVFVAIILVAMDEARTRHVIAATQSAKTSKLKYPESRRVDQVDEFFGVKVQDPYRWLEAEVRESPEVAQWVKRQNNVAREYLDAIPERDAIEKRLTELWNYERYSPPVQKGGKYFYMKNDGLQNQPVMFVADSYKAEGH